MIQPGQLVVASCTEPREKFWGVLLELSAVGVTLRGIPIDALEDWLRQWAVDGPRELGAVTMFLPLHRVERIELDETSGMVEGIGQRFERVSGRDAARTLLLRREEGGDGPEG